MFSAQVSHYSNSGTDSNNNQKGESSENRSDGSERVGKKSFMENFAIFGEKGFYKPKASRFCASAEGSFIDESPSEEDEHSLNESFTAEESHGGPSRASFAAPKCLGNELLQLLDESPNE